MNIFEFPQWEEVVKILFPDNLGMGLGGVAPTKARNLAKLLALNAARFQVGTYCETVPGRVCAGFGAVLAASQLARHMTCVSQAHTHMSMAGLWEARPGGPLAVGLVDLHRGPSGEEVFAPVNIETCVQLVGQLEVGGLWVWPFKQWLALGPMRTGEGNDH